MSQVQQRKSTRKENADFTKAKFKGKRFKSLLFPPQVSLANSLKIVEFFLVSEKCTDFQIRTAISFNILSGFMRGLINSKKSDQWCPWKNRTVHSNKWFLQVE